MTKEELLEMVNATISGNGKQEITGQSLNLALTEIINAMGTGSGSGGGGLMIQWLPRFALGEYIVDGVVTLPPEAPQGTAEALQEYLDNNIKVYNTIMECSNNHTPIPGPIYFDTTFFEWYYNQRENSVRGGCALSWRVGYDGVIYLESSAQDVNSGQIYVQSEVLWSDGLIGEPNSNLPS